MLMHELQGLAIDVKLLDENNNEVSLNDEDDVDDDSVITVDAIEHKEEEGEPADQMLENDLEDELDGFSLEEDEEIEG